MKITIYGNGDDADVTVMGNDDDGPEAVAKVYKKVVSTLKEEDKE